MKKNTKSNSISIQTQMNSKFKPTIDREDSDMILKRFLNLKLKYGKMKESPNLKFIPKTNRDKSPSPYELSEFICGQINIKKKNRLILPPLKGRNNKKTTKEIKTLEDVKDDKQREIFNVIHSIKERNEASFNKSKMYETRLYNKKTVSSHDLFNIIMLKKGFIH